MGGYGPILAIYIAQRSSLGAAEGVEGSKGRPEGCGEAAVAAGNDTAEDMERAAATGDVPAFIVDQEGYRYGTLLIRAARPR